MRPFRAAVSRIRGMFGKSRHDGEWQEEIQSHLQMHIEDNLRAGMTPEQARRSALVRFGGIQPARGAYRDQQGLPWLETRWQDLRHGVRTLRKQPAFTVVVVLTLALGVGANTAMFSLIDAVLLKLLPVSHPEQLVYVDTSATKVGNIRLTRTIFNRDLEQMRKRSKQVSGISSHATAARLNIGVNGHPELASGHFVGGTYFAVLGVQPILGRAIQPIDEHADGRVAMLGYGYWRRRFGGDTAVLGKAITVSGVPFTIVGVTPPEFHGLDDDVPAQVVLPYATIKQVDAGRASSEEPAADGSPGYVFARLPNGVAVPSAAAELGHILRQTERQAGGTADQLSALDQLSIDLHPASRALSNARNRFSEPLAVLMAVVALVMLIACANIANLLLAKAGVRQREIAIRLSLGSSRRRLVRQLLTESLLLSLLGGLIGVLLAVWARQAIVYLVASGDNTPAIPPDWNWRVLSFTAAVCIVNALLFGLAPALRATAVDLVSMLKGSRSFRPSGRFRLGRILVVGQIALSLALLIAAGLFLGTFRNLDRIDPGFDRDGVLMVTLDPTMAGYRGDKVVQTFKTALERTSAIPGVRAVTLLRDRILTGQISMTSIWVPGYTLRNDESVSNQWVVSNAAGPRFFSIAGIRLVQGRDFSERDDEHSPKVAIVNQSLANHFFSGQNPIGQHIAWSRTDPPVEIVGVVRDIAYLGLRSQSQDVVFTPIFQTTGDGAWNSATIFIRTAGDSALIAGAIRSAIQAIDPNLPPYGISTMNQQVGSTLAQPRMLATLTIFFGLLALTLSAVGLYGVVSYGVTQRTGEIGLRMALGASRGSILNLALGETAAMASAGILLGTGMALTAARLVRSMLYGVTAVDTPSLAAAIGLLTAVALCAGFWPARRASRVDPMTALRYE